MQDSLMGEGPGALDDQKIKSEVSESILSARSLSKTFPGTRALQSVDLDIRAGEIHALVGQNGSGKSTLIKVFAGYHVADPGSAVTVVGTDLNVTKPLAQHDRLRFVHQDLGLFLELSAMENLALRSEFVVRRSGLIRWKEQAAAARALIDQFSIDLDVRRPLSEATPVQRTIVAIAAALANWDPGPGVLVLDEPTAVLPPSEVGVLLDIVKAVKDRGTSVLYVSHRLDEVLELADRVTVLRGGQVVVTRDVADLDTQMLAELMVGEGVDARYRAHLVAPGTEAQPIMAARDLNGPSLRHVDVELFPGEILGIAGLPGSGRTELPYALAGKHQAVRGSIRFAGQEWGSVQDADKNRVALVPADRAREAVVKEFSVMENLTLASIGTHRRAGLLNHSAEASDAARWAKQVEIKASSPRALISSLSGGNQQKVIVARCLATEPEVLVLCEPSAGVDVGTRQAIYRMLAERARNGLSIVVSSSDIGDLLAVCTRVLVMCNGRITRQLTGADITESALITAMEETEQI